MTPTFKYFKYKHLPQRLQEVSKSVCDVAAEMECLLPDSAEKSAGMRKLLEAKDCFVRAALDEQERLAEAREPPGSSA
jgi:hypothetical protein